MAGKLGLLTFKQEAFCRAWVQFNGNGCKAALLVYEIKGKEILEQTIVVADHIAQKERKRIQSVGSQIAYENLRLPDIRARIEEMFEEKGLTDIRVKMEHFKMIMQDENLPVKQRAVEAFYRLMGKYECYKTKPAILSREEVEKRLANLKIDKAHTKPCSKC